VDAYRHAIDIMITAMDILVDNSGYPTESIVRNSHDYRPLGLGYANLGALLMAMGLPYDSDAGRDFAAALTAIMCGQAYLQSSVLAEKAPALVSATALCQQAQYADGGLAQRGGACPGFYVNREPFLDVIRMHRAEVNKIGHANSAEPFTTPQLASLIEASKDCWDQALAHGEQHGYRNSQVTVLAPTGTIGFMMDCDTTGIEPDLALIKYKKLVGGGMIKIVNNTVPVALFKLGYTNPQVDSIVSYIDSTGTIEGAPGIKPEHLAVFDCSFKPSKGNALHPLLRPHQDDGRCPAVPLRSHLQNRQPAPRRDPRRHHSGLYRGLASGPQSSGRLPRRIQGRSAAQRLRRQQGQGHQECAGRGKQCGCSRQRCRRPCARRHGARRHRLDRRRSAAAGGQGLGPARGHCQLGRDRGQCLLRVHRQRRQPGPGCRAARRSGGDPGTAPRRPSSPAGGAPSLTHKFSIAGHEGYITVGLYPNGQPGEIFIKMAKEGSTVSGLMDSFATAVSLSLQHGVPLKVLCEKFAHTRFEPSGWTGNEQIGFAKSIMDYIFRWLQLRFLSGHQLSSVLRLGSRRAIPSALVDEPCGGSKPGMKPGRRRRHSY
jgi:ribonucleoside-diphosphate reductase alpha chain